MKDKKDNNNFKLKKLFLKYPYFKLKREFLNLNFWNFLNIYNFYFCFCLGELCPKNISQNCKYFFYLFIIDNNRNIYKKNHYLFSDFIFSEYSSDDTYPVFEQMEKKKFKVHYITEKYDIYKKYCYKIKKCLLVLLVNKKNYKINGDFLEKYLTIILKLKAVISGGGVNFNYIYNLFYIIEYISYISVGHGVSFFKYFLYADYSGYGSKVYNKILLPPSSQIISVAKKFGWKEKNIIKINLPRWDKYNSNTRLETKNNLKNNSIFIMFTWRDLKKNKKISSYYFKNILTLIESHKLNDVLKKKKIKLYFSLHHQLKQYNNKLKKNKYFSFIDENQISECLRKINLLITDFSSIIFDIIYRRKPFIIYIPDSSDPNLKNIYKNNYVDIIESLKNETIKFENKYFNVEQVIDKIIYYINNNFKLDLNLIKFYDKMGLITGNNINKFIEYLKKLK
jgi:CDP-glycerol glycerophosphotransferase (TagB/SpsB family)